MKAFTQFLMLSLTAMIATGQSAPPITATLTIDPGYIPLDAWTLNIRTNGQATFTRMFSSQTNTLAFSAEQMSRLSALAASNGFFASSNVFGEHIIDASTRKITVASGNRSNTVEVLGLHNWALPKHKDHTRMVEVVPTLEIWDEVESWIKEDGIIRFRQWDMKDREIARRLQQPPP